MRSGRRGKRTSAVEVTNVSSHGFWLLHEGRERFLSFQEFPWFRKAAIDELLSVEMPHAGHLYWPELDVDLAVASIDHPERFPLISRIVRAKSARRTRSKR